MTEISTSLRRALFAAALGAMASLPLSALNVDFTDYISNHSFEAGFNGWTQTGMQSQTNSTFPLKDGNTYVEKWVPSNNGAGACSVKQLVTGLLPGDYTLTAAAQNLREGNEDIQTGVWVYAGENQTPVNVVADYSVDFSVGADGEMEIGYKAIDATGNYLAVDNFRLVYTAYNAEDMTTFVNNTCTSAEALLSEKIGNSAKSDLSDAIAALKNALDTSDVEAIAAAMKDLRLAEAAAKESIAAYASLKTAIDELAVAYEEIKDQEGAETIGSLLESARATYEAAEATNEEIEAIVLELNNAILMYRIDHSTAAAPEVTTHPYLARGATYALGRSTIKLPAGTSLREAGFCWSTSHNPTVADYRSSKTFNHNGTIYHLTGMQPSTIYYVRAYAITTDYGVGYGDEEMVITIPKGTITWSYTPNDATDEQSQRITSATAGAVEYWNMSTSIHGFHATVNYNAGTPTADCSYGGWIRMGSNASYQRIGTVMHEMNHGVGVGQHTIWYGPSSIYRANGNSGDWLGTRATELVRFLTNDPEAVLHGDTQHMWPYGINGAHEDTGQEILYLANGLVTQAVGEDAVPPVAGQFHTPSYYFPCRSGVKYYLKIEASNKEPYLRYLIEGENNLVDWAVMTSDEATADDHAAWYLEFDPVTCYYTFKNAATGNYMIWSPSNRNTIMTAAEPGDDDINLFQLTGSVKKTPVADRNEYTYWITVGSGTDNPRAVAIASSKNSCLYTNFKNADANAPLQRWHIFTQADMHSFDDAAAGLNDVEVEQAAQFPADVYDVCGRLVVRGARSLDGLAPGVYIVNNRKVFVQ